MEDAIKPKAVILIVGGVLQSVYSNLPDLDVVLVDEDDLKADGKTDKQVSAKWQRLKLGMHCAH
jgi:hypothetical protein